MIPEAHRGLWSKIQNFPLNDPAATVKFSHKLAAQQEWSETFTDRVVEEYRKFVFLCCVSPTGASPSHNVDQVWHLHLTYTRSYWIDFCKNTLNKELHHHPSAGGEAEDHKHENWYAETLLLYETTFGYKPPADIWPPPGKQQELIEEPVIRVPLKTKLKAVTIMLLPFLFIAIAFGKWFPYRLTGPQFLVFYPVFAFAVWYSHILVQKAKNKVWDDVLQRCFPEDATLFQVTHFLYGKHRAVQAAIVDLVRRNLLEVNRDKTFTVYNKWYTPAAPELNPLMAGVLAENDCSRISYEEITINWYREEDFAHPVLQQLYQLAYHNFSVTPSVSKVFFLLAVGAARVVQGAMNQFPAGFLMLEMFVSAPVTIHILQSHSRRALFFKAAIKCYHSRHDREAVYSDELVARYGIEGNEGLLFFSDGILLASIFEAYQPIDHARTKSGVDISSSCSSCGGGDGCGGGGCGGCGGGD